MNTTDSPTIQKFHLDGIKHIAPENAFSLISNDETFFIDVREEIEFKQYFFDFTNVFFHPMSVITDRLQYIPKNVSLVIVCEEGTRSAKVVNLLNRQGFENVANLDGGIQSWIDKGLPGIIVNDVLNSNEDSCQPSSCGCSCSGCGE